MTAPVVDLTIVRGKTFEFAFRYADDELVYKPITAMLSTAPVRLTVVDHGLPDGWPIQIQSVKAPQELNSSYDTGCCRYYFAKVIDDDTIELNNINASDWKTYLPSGYVVFPQPVDITGYSARMEVRTSVGGSLLLTLDSDHLSLPDGAIEVDTLACAFVLHLEAATTAGLDFRTGVYDVELTSPSGDVSALTAISSVEVLDEVTQ